MVVRQIDGVSYYATEGAVGQIEADGLDVEFVMKAISASMDEETTPLFESDDCLIMGKAIGYIMLWAKYRKTPGGIEVLGAYYHRAFPISDR